MIKNMKVSAKLASAFIIFGALYLISIVIALTSVINLQSNMDGFYNGAFQTTNRTGDMRTSLQAMEKSLYQAGATVDLVKTRECVEAVDTEVTALKEDIEFLRNAVKLDESLQLLTQFENKMTELQPLRTQAQQLFLENRNDEAMLLMTDQYTPEVNKARDILIELDNVGYGAAEDLMNEATAMRNSVFMLLLCLAVVSAAIAVTLCVVTTRSIVRPLKEIESVAKEFSTGKLDVNVSYESSNELGSLAQSMREIVSRLSTIIADVQYCLGEMGGGNFRVHTKAEEQYTGGFLPILTAMRGINNRMSDTLRNINQSADQVSTGAGQVSTGSQALAQGATEQASSVQQLASSINLISEQVRSNAQHAAEADKEARTVGDEISESNEKMQAMIKAMSEISNSSNEIGKIIKTIEDIAFQTNILALNAAVEAARAGEAGKGFAVVADEVRNLASKSGEAAKNTTALIEGSIQAVENGTKIADETAESLVTVVEGVKAVSRTVNSISKATEEQAKQIEQVTLGVDQISSVVQTNSATAEESAAASEELSSQAALLKELVGGFKLKPDVNTPAININEKVFASKAAQNAGHAKY